ncbi:RING finger protein 212B-like [Homalodisca vitripennis]|nr:RING finger protein 212B-like [Homalodisca vitripennis]
MDWVHCNSCFYQPGQIPKRDFKLTSCGHIFCQCCERGGTIEACKMCGIKCTTTALSAQMAKEVQVYFEDPESSLDKLRKVMDFQKSHRQKLNENYRRLFEKYQMLKVGYQKLEEEMKRLRQELEIIKGNTNCANILTPPQSSNQYPLFSKNSQASKVIRLGMSQPLGNGNPASPLFVTPSKTGFSGQQYRFLKTPSTPGSDVSSNSPASISCNFGFQNVQANNTSRPSSAQRQYKPSLSPAMNSLRLLSVKPRY